MNFRVIKSKKRKQALKEGYRSYLELEVSWILDKADIKYEYESIKLEYIQKVAYKKVKCTECGCTDINETKQYTPDFILRSSKTILEVKGLLTSKDKKKMLKVAEMNPQWKIVMVFQNSKRKLTKKSKKTYADWCDNNNLDWCDYKSLKF